MPKLRRGAIAALPLLATLPAIVPGCGEESQYPGDGRAPIGEISSEVSKATRVARYKKIKAGAAAKGIPSRGYLLAGVAYHESAGLSQCQSELTWACKGPASSDCNGGPIMAGAGDGPCSAKQGGLGIFQFDAGTYSQTIAAYGNDVLTIEGATKDAVGFIVNMVRKSVYTTNAETDAKALAWINKFDPSNKTLRDQWIKTVLRYYNGCQPTWSCWNERYPQYNQGLSTVIADTGLAWWEPEPPPPPPETAPEGQLDKAGCDAITGWAQDPDAKTKAIAVQLFFDGPSGKGHQVNVTADDVRQDLCKPLGSCNHAFTVASPFSLFDNKPHDVYAYGIDSAGKKNGALAKSPGKLTCLPKIPAGVTRWITDAKSLAAWKFQPYFDQLPAAKADVDAIERDDDLPAAPVLQQVEGDPAVWLVDGKYKHHVPSAAVLAAWRMSKDDIKKTTKAALDKLVKAADVRPRPVLVADSSGKVLLIDTALPTEPSSGGAGGSAGAAGTAGAAGSTAGQAGAGGDDGDAGAGGADGGEGGVSGSAGQTASAAGKGGASAGGSGGSDGGASGSRGRDDVDVQVEPTDEGGCVIHASSSAEHGPEKTGPGLLVALGALVALATRRRATR